MCLFGVKNILYPVIDINMMRMVKRVSRVVILRSLVIYELLSRILITRAFMLTPLECPQISSLIDLSDSPLSVKINRLNVENNARTFYLNFVTQQ